MNYSFNSSSHLQCGGIADADRSSANSSGYAALILRLSISDSIDDILDC